MMSSPMVLLSVTVHCSSTFWSPSTTYDGGLIIVTSLTDVAAVECLETSNVLLLLAHLVQ